MRQIKFRGKTESGEWIYGYYSVFDDRHAIMPDDGLWRKVIPESVGQFIGLKDSRGIDMYAGMNFWFKNPVREFQAAVVYIEESAAFGYKRIDRDFPSPFSEWDELEVDFLPYVEVFDM